MNIEKNKLIIGIVAIVILVIGGVVAFNLIQPKEPTLEEANVILDESIRNTFALTSFTTKGNADFQVKSGEIVIVEATMRDVRSSMTGLWDLVNMDSSTVVTYDIMLNLNAIANLIEANVPSEELSPDMFMGMNPIAMLRTIGKANIAVTMEMKSIDSNSYMKVAEVTGLREVITTAAGAPMAEMIMGRIEPKIGIWYKTPADPEMIEEMKPMYEKIDPLMNVIVKSLPDILFVKEVLPNTRVNDTAVYNFTTDIDLNKTRDLVISLIPIIGEMAEVDNAEIIEVKQSIKENWPKFVTVMKAAEIDGRTYICQERKVVLRESITVNINLYHIITALEPMITEEMTPEELAKFNEQKEAVRDFNFVITGNFTYSNHNAVPAILPPAEYQLIE